MKKEYFLVNSVNELSGTIEVHGSKNLMLQVIWLPLIVSAKVTLHNVPKISDTQVCIEILEGLGVKIYRLSDTSFSFDGRLAKPDFFYTDEFFRLAKKIRGSVTMMGASVARFGEFVLRFPGGDKIGLRPIDVHRNGIVALGAELRNDTDKAVVVCKNLIGAKIFQSYPSVTGTASTLMAAVMAKGTTVINNAACEPYLAELVKSLNKSGAKITGGGTNTLVIEGVDILNYDVELTLIPDMIETASFMSLSHLVGGNGLTIKNAIPFGDEYELGLLFPIFKKLGLNFDLQGNDINIQPQDIYSVENGSITIVDGPWPQFCPDWLSPMLVFSTQVSGQVLWHQQMFEDRLYFVDNLRHMGCNIHLMNRHEVIVIGGNKQNGGRFKLNSMTLASPDIRAGIAMLIAALSAKETSLIFNVDQIDRGYADIEERLNSIGCVIERNSLS